MEEKLYNLRHSLAHILASAVLKFDPKAKLGIGPVIENGFYYDFLFSKKIVEDDLSKIEEIMRGIIKQNLDFKKKTASFEVAKKLFSAGGGNSQQFKLGLINDLKRYGTAEVSEIQLIKEKKAKAKKIKTISLYQTGDFIDVCRGGHVKNTKEINPDAFKLIKLAGAYWRGDSKNQMLTRIYGSAFEVKNKLEQYIQRLQDAELYNHRVLGEKLGIFLISEKVGQGFPMLLPNGEKIKHELTEYMRQKEEAAGYQYVSTPVLSYGALYEASGHKKYFSQDMYRFNDPDGNEIFIKPMNCPHHHMIYQKLVRSYRDLTLKLGETGAVYRHELSGTLYGIGRVRGPITQNDAHIYTAEEQLEDEFRKVARLVKEVYDEIKVIKNYWFRLSLPDFSGKNKGKYGGDLKLWQWASKVIKESAKKEKIDFVEAVGEAAFYGPKLDMQIRNIFGREETIATIQIDILVPKRMGLVYVDKAGKEKYPIIIHRAILGSFERFIAFLLEETRGNLPLWLSPVQAIVLSISDKFNDYTMKIFEELKRAGFRVEIDSRNETLNKKIMEAEMKKIPFIAVVGNKEMSAGAVNIRERGVKGLKMVAVKDFIDILADRVKMRA